MRLILSLFILSSFTPNALADFDVENLRLKSFADLGLPQTIKKSEVTWAIQQAVDQLYGVGYVDLGDMSDFMHGHFFLPSVDQEPLLILFHTKEYSFLRKGRPYQIGNRILPDGSDRNWILWLKNHTGGRRGQIVPAHPLSIFPTKLKRTITIADLSPELFGKIPEDSELSIYFLRIGCEIADANSDALNNLLEVHQGSERQRICLALLDFHCRNHYQKDARCREGQDLLPSYLEITNKL